METNHMEHLKRYTLLYKLVLTDEECMPRVVQKTDENTSREFLRIVYGQRKAITFVLVEITHGGEILFIK